jgi:hypothetical protein
MAPYVNNAILGVKNGVSSIVERKNLYVHRAIRTIVFIYF